MHIPHLTLFFELLHDILVPIAFPVKLPTTADPSVLIIFCIGKNFPLKIYTIISVNS